MRSPDDDPSSGRNSHAGGVLCFALDLIPFSLDGEDNA
jgi:hypothetical protein